MYNFYIISGHGQLEQLKFHLKQIESFEFIDLVILSTSTQEMVDIFKQHCTHKYHIIKNIDYGYRRGCVVNVLTPLEYIKANYSGEYIVISTEADAFFCDKTKLQSIIYDLQKYNRHMLNMDFSIHGFNINCALQTINVFTSNAINKLLNVEVDEEFADQNIGMEDYWRLTINKHNNIHSYTDQLSFHTKNVLELKYNYTGGDTKLIPDRFQKYGVINMPPVDINDIEKFITDTKISGL